MSTLLIHPVSQKMLERTLLDLPQSLLCSGQRGVGLRTIARQVAGSQLVAEVRPQDTKEHIDSENGTISVEMIRRLYDRTRAKHGSRQIIIVDDADRMSLGAQSAFLKLLEEPNSQIHFILTSHNPQKLLPTILSRVQHITLHPLTPLQSSTFLTELKVQESIKQSQLRFIAEGLPAELTRLANNEVYFKERAEIISDSRDFLQGDTYKKLLIIQKYRSNREMALQLIDSTMYILRRSVSTKPQHTQITQLERLLDAKERIASNYSASLQLTQFVL